MLDASVALAWSIPDERSAHAIRLLDRCKECSATVPGHWPTEVANGLLMAERKGRMSRSLGEELLLEFSRLPIEIRQASIALTGVLTLAREHGLTAYDAAYLHVAAESRLELATFDDALTRAALKLGVPLL